MTSRSRRDLCADDCQHPSVDAPSRLVTPGGTRTHTLPTRRAALPIETYGGYGSQRRLLNPCVEERIAPSEHAASLTRDTQHSIDPGPLFVYRRGSRGKVRERGNPVTAKVRSPTFAGVGALSIASVASVGSVALKTTGCGYDSLAYRPGCSQSPLRCHTSPRRAVLLFIQGGWAVIATHATNCGRECTSRSDRGRPRWQGVSPDTQLLGRWDVFVRYLTRHATARRHADYFRPGCLSRVHGCLAASRERRRARAHSRRVLIVWQ